MTPKALAKAIVAIKRDLCLGHTESVSALLESAASPEVLQALREQKILFRVPSGSGRHEVADILKAAAARVLEPHAGALYHNYIDLAVWAVESAARLAVQVEQVLQALPTLSRTTLLLLGQKHQEAMLDAAEERQSLAPPPDGTPLRETVAAEERHLHELHAVSNTIFLAVTRALNEASKHVGGEDRVDVAKLATASEPFHRLVDLAFTWNSLEFIVDSVTFGDLAVREWHGCSSGGSAKLEFVDPKRSLYRRLAIRRRVARSQIHVRPPRDLRDYLAPVIRALVPAAIIYYETLCGCRRICGDDRDLCESRALQLLDPLDLEDDLLFGIPDESFRVAAHYIAAAGLLSCACVAQIMRDRLPEGFSERLVAVKIPFGLITGTITGKEPVQLALKEALRDLCVAIPATRHSSLVRMPFVRIAADCAQLLGTRYNINWNTAVREILIDGGDLGRTLGAVWEAFMAVKLQHGGWTVVGKNICIRVDGRVVTDIDIVLARGDVLLVIQVKSVTGCAMNTYDHWKNRNIIEKGCHQARLAADLLRNEPQRLIFLANRALASRIRHIEPVVLTNCLELDRWEHQGVAVLGPVGLDALVAGAQVSYMDTRTGRAIETREFTPRGQMSTESILWILRNSLEPLICPEDGRVEWASAQFEGVRWEMPTFAAKWGLE